MKPTPAPDIWLTRAIRQLLLRKHDEAGGLPTFRTIAYNGIVTMGHQLILQSMQGSAVDRKAALVILAGLLEFCPEVEVAKLEQSSLDILRAEPDERLKQKYAFWVASALIARGEFEEGLKLYGLFAKEDQVAMAALAVGKLGFSKQHMSEDDAAFCKIWTTL
jgi:hypothetical protein